MANQATKTIKQAQDVATKEIEELDEDFHNAFDERLAALRSEIATIAETVHDFTLDTYDGALDLVEDARHQAARAGRQIGRSASAAGHVVKENPVPTIALLGTIALLAALAFQRSDYHR